jgi:hypothetical protein
MTTKKGQKRLKNIPILHEEVKTKRTVVLTPSAWEISRMKRYLVG